MYDLFTIGHSTHSVEYFLEMLTSHRIAAVCDVRSNPYSRHAPQFNRESLRTGMEKRKISYLYFGTELGPRSKDPNCYEGDRVQYSRLAGTDLYRQGLDRLRREIASRPAALMCAEKDPINCHRMILVCRSLRKFGLRMAHILANGSLEDNTAAEVRLIRRLKIPAGGLFEDDRTRIEKAYDLQSFRIAYRRKI
ncbi:MAG: DUF488 domain-containing protein [Syntrophales bacterium]|nr:DUF488 domain-containing protein [Syntrophales bacterium]MDD5232335.1 DUF488 domain-containing protein [Syntrophales bacterium]MDD5531651.1 DUF488 domain-containing protein [Syntrophales bacterium]